MDEFLSALSGFLGKQALPSDPGQLRFLEIFFRTVKSDKGHLLKVTETGQLVSVVSTGIGTTFDEDFNLAHASAVNEPSPLDMAFREREPIAIVDLSRDPDIPVWFADLMKKYKFVSLVAVPLMGENKPIGILCAYYQDVCLFDRATLGHLMMIGRMVGSASEKSQVAQKAASHGEKEKSADQFLRILTTKVFSKIQIYSMLAKIASESLPITGLMCGPLSKSNQGLMMTVFGGMGLPASTQSTQIALPVFLATRFMTGTLSSEGDARSERDWGALAPYVNSPQSVDLTRSIQWQNTLEGAVVAWRNGQQRFDADEVALLGRLCDIAALALHAGN
jgi:hypothetical protein